MRMTQLIGAGCAVTLAVLAFASAAQAQATRTWVSGVGDDANPCSRTAPCKTFAGAISKTAAGGEINTLDPGGFGTVTITKAITIANDGAGTAGVLSSGTNGININAGANDKVTLRGLTIDGAGTGINGIVFFAGGSLNIENVYISNVTNFGILAQPGTAAKIHIENSTIENAGSGVTGGAVLLRPVSSGSIQASLNRVFLESNVLGLRAENSNSGTGAITVSVVDSEAGNNTYSGIVIAQTAGSGAVSVNIDRSALVNNGVGLNLSGASAVMRVSNSMITGNALGVNSSTTNLLSYGNNHVDDNTSPGTSMPIIPQK